MNGKYFGFPVDRLKHVRKLQQTLKTKKKLLDELLKYQIGLAV